MPEHDLFDLDAAFSALERDVSTLSSAPGAGRAVARARRRRRTTVAAVAAVALIAVGGVVVGQGRGQDRVVDPADQPPARAKLTAAVLTAATDGWTPAWAANTKAAQHRMQQVVAHDDCFPAFSGGVPDGYTVFGNSHDDLGITTIADFTGDPSGEPVVWQRMVDQMEGCAQEVRLFGGASTGLEGYTFQIPATGTESAPEYVWIASTDKGIGVLKILGQSGPLPSSNDTAVTKALVAAVEQRVATSTPQTDGSEQPAEPELLMEFRSARLQGALGKWQSGWHDGPPPEGLRDEPCGNAAWGGAGKDTNIGVDGLYWDHQFPSTIAAEAGYQQIQQALRDCAGYTTRTVTEPGGPGVFTARGDRDVWAIRHDDWVVVTYLPRADTPPPDSVSTAMGAAMGALVEATLARWESTN